MARSLAKREIAIVLVRPSEEGNVGAAARAMANMGLERLIVVEPAAAVGPVARAFAVGAAHVLDGIVRQPSLAAALARFARIVGTTTGRQRQLGRDPVSPRRLPDLLAEDPPERATALVFGPEASGLTAEELAHCGLLVRVPTAPRQPTLNLAQAVLVVAWELFAAGEEAPPPATAPATATAAEVEALVAHGARLLRGVGFARDDTFAGVMRDLRALAARALLTRREVDILHGICRRTLAAVAAARDPSHRGKPGER